MKILVKNTSEVIRKADTSEYMKLVGIVAYTNYDKLQKTKVINERRKNEKE